MTEIAGVIERHQLLAGHTVPDFHGSIVARRRYPVSIIAIDNACHEVLCLRV